MQPASQDRPVESDRSRQAAMVRMKVGRSVLVVVHADHDSLERANRRHHDQTDQRRPGDTNLVRQ